MSGARRLYLKECESTQDLAWQQPPPCFVAAGTQRSGRGRGAGREWYSPGGGIYLSFHFEVADPQGLSLLGGVAVVRCLRRRGLKPWLKWPNDVYLETLKLAGVLPDVRWAGARCLGAVLGIGCNVRVDDVPEGGGSLHRWLPEVRLDELLPELQMELEQLVASHRREGPAAYWDEAQEASLPVGTEVEYSQSGVVRRGTVESLVSPGWLKLKDVAEPLVSVEWLRAPHFAPPAF